ncbi:MAG: UDP-3-O-acyl-N-acetylglucosamine deacetylase [Clostridiaceae bacterium]|nr:UDP-3-O-acyl-N-acetylglucosamine deacetylase [Clostridiaceae bacterium]
MCNQTTINRKASVIGTSITGGTDAKVSFYPAQPDTGIIFIRGDLPGRPGVKCSFEKAKVEYRWTSLIDGNMRIEHTEHALATISGLGIDNVYVELEQPSLPVTPDYSSKVFTQALMEAGIVEQPAKKEKIKIHKPVIVYQREKLLIALPYNGFKLTYVLDYPKLPWLSQIAEIDVTPQTFINEIADARSYIIESELEEVVNLTGKVSSNVLVVKSGAEQRDWLWPNEPARHKALDLLGDLGLLGKKIWGHVIGIRSGHRLNLELCKKIYGECNDDCFG